MAAIAASGAVGRNPPRPPTPSARRWDDAGAACLVLTEISRDGMLGGLDLDGITRVAIEVGIPVIASGGVGALAHLEALVAAAEDSPNIEGVIVGRALYDGRITLRDAIDLLTGVAC